MEFSPSMYAPLPYTVEEKPTRAAYVRRYDSEEVQSNYAYCLCSPRTWDSEVVKVARAFGTGELTDGAPRNFDSYYWKKIRADVERFSELEDDWDGFGSVALTRETVDAALAAMASCEGMTATPEWATPTIDSTVLVKFHVPGVGSFKIEVQDPSSIGVAKWAEGSAEPTFHDATLETLSTVLAS